MTGKCMCRTSARRAICNEGTITKGNQLLAGQTMILLTSIKGYWLGALYPGFRLPDLQTGTVSLMGALGTITNLFFQLVNSGQPNDVKSDPTVNGNMDRVVTIKCV